MLCIQRDKALVELYQGDSLVVEVTVHWENGAVADLTGFHANFTAADGAIEKDSADPDQVVITDPKAGKYQVYLVPADTLELNKNYDYEYRTQVYDDSGNVYTVLSGVFRVL